MVKPKKGTVGAPPKDDAEALDKVRAIQAAHPKWKPYTAALHYARQLPQGKVKPESIARRLADKLKATEAAPEVAPTSPPVEHVLSVGHKSKAKDDEGSGYSGSLLIDAMKEDLAAVTLEKYLNDPAIKALELLEKRKRLRRGH